MNNTEPENTPSQTPPETAPAEESGIAAAPSSNDPSDIENAIVEALKTVFDPEIPVNIYEMGLIYDIDLLDEGAVKVKMTLTSPGCPVAGTLPGEVQAKVQGVPGVGAVDVELVWDPTWNPSMMSEAARLELGMF
jgi:FeS assembly SUF system protein